MEDKIEDDVAYIIERLQTIELKTIQKEEIKNEIKTIGEEITSKISPHLEGILLQVAKDSGNRDPIEVHVKVDSRGQIQGHLVYDEPEENLGYLEIYNVDNKPIGNWVTDEFKKRVSEFGIPEKYVSYVNIDALFPK